LKWHFNVAKIGRKAKSLALSPAAIDPSGPLAAHVRKNALSIHLDDSGGQICFFAFDEPIDFAPALEGGKRNDIV